MNILTAITTGWQKALAYIGVAAVLLIAGAIGGYKYCSNRNAAAVAKVATQMQRAENQTAIIQAQLDELLKVHALNYITLKMEILPNVNLVKIPGQPVSSRPDYYLTNFDLCVYNRGLQVTGSPSGSNAAAPCSGIADAYALSSIDFGTELANSLLNFQQYADCRAVVSSWQQWYEALPKAVK